MARKRKPKQTEQAPVTLKELPRDTEELTSAEAEAAKGGFFGAALIAARLQYEEDRTRTPEVGDNQITDGEYWSISR